jgi:hypothetical protein
MSAWQYHRTSQEDVRGSNCSIWIGDRSATIDTPKSVIEAAGPQSRAESRRLMRENCYGIGPTTVARQAPRLMRKMCYGIVPHPIHIDCCDMPLHAGRQTTGDGRI